MASIPPGPLKVPQMQPLQGIQPVRLNVSVAQSPTTSTAGAPVSSQANSQAGNNSGNPAAPGQQVSIPQRFQANDRLANQWERATTVCTSIDGMLATLAELYEVNNFWKEKYISTKKENFSKYMTTSSGGLKSAVFASWKGYTFETFSDRKLEGKQEDIDQLHRDCQALMDRREEALQKKLEAMEKRHEASLSEMGSVIEKQNHQISTLQFEISDIIAKTDTSKGVMKTVRQAIMGVAESDYKVHDPDEPEIDAHPHANNFEFAKQTMHDILNEVDPKYVPPVGSLCVGPPPAPVGSPLLRKTLGDYNSGAYSGDFLGTSSRIGASMEG
ncbi:unnamed protein product [Amoebophrya sp. A120]|nr:unnamed protein product [Amoebophrya sp. A120]|eukprot:GSA120T00007266001.1